MNSLVAYDSSSGDESYPEKVAVSNGSGKVSANDVVTSKESTASIAINDTPMVGPSIPSDIVQEYDGYEDEFPATPQGSERDTIRYLTQPSHPMMEIPPSPPGSPNASTAARIKHFLDLKSKGIHFNEDLAKKNAFKNPSLLQSLMVRVDVDSQTSYGTSLPLDVFDPFSFPSAGYKEALLKSQQTIRAKEEAEKKVLSNAGRRVIEFAPGGISTPSSTTSLPGNLHKRHKK